MTQRLTIIALALALFAACSSGPSAPDESTYVNGLMLARTAKDQQFREASDSPVPKDRRDTLLPLRYFPSDPNYSVPAALKL